MNRESDNPVPTTPQQVNYMQMLPGGICFAHGPYKDTIGCPKWPACATDPQKPEYIAMARHAPPSAPGETPEQIANRLNFRIEGCSATSADGATDYVFRRCPTCTQLVCGCAVPRGSWKPAAAPASELCPACLRESHAPEDTDHCAYDRRVGERDRRTYPEPPAPASEREAVLEEVCNVIAYWADTHRGETTYGEAKRVLIERVRAMKGKGGGK